jgi:hypothetical protein
MKRLLMLAIVVGMTTATVGCGCGSWFRRGQECNTCPTGPYGAASPVTTMPAETYLPAPG